MFEGKWQFNRSNFQDEREPYHRLRNVLHPFT